MAEPQDNTTVVTSPVDFNKMRELQKQFQKRHEELKSKYPAYTNESLQTLEALDTQLNTPNTTSIKQDNRTPQERTKGQQKAKELQQRGQDAVGYNAALRMVGASNLSYKEAYNNPDTVAENYRQIKDNIGTAIALAYPIGYGMATLKAAGTVGKVTYHTINGATAAMSAKDMYDNGVGFWNTLGLAGSTVPEYVLPEFLKVYNDGIIWDKYTTLNGRIGYWGNSKTDRILGTLQRRIGLPHKASNPELMRKIIPTEETPNLVYENGQLVIGDNTLQQDFLQGRLNQTYINPVISHGKNSWNSGNLIIYPYRITNGKVTSIEPMDFITETSKLTASPGNATVVSGDVNVLTEAKNNKFDTLSSPKARSLYNKMIDWQKEQDGLKTSSDFMIKLKAEPHYKNPYAKLYSQEIQRLQGLRGRPSIKDIRYLESNTGLQSGIDETKNYQNIKDQVMLDNPRKLGESFGDYYNRLSKIKVKMPNGDEVPFSRIDTHIKAMEEMPNNLPYFYNPLPYVDSKLYSR